MLSWDDSVGDGTVRRDILDMTSLSLSLLYCSNVSILFLRKYLEGQISEFIRQYVGKVFYVILQLPFQILHSQVALMKTVYLFNVPSM